MNDRSDAVTELLTKLAADPAYAKELAQELNKDLGAALREAREARGMRQKDVAAAMGVGQARVSQIESTAGVEMTLDVLARYVTALRYRLDIEVRDPSDDSLVASLPVVPSSLWADGVSPDDSGSAAEPRTTRAAQPVKPTLAS